MSAGSDVRSVLVVDAEPYICRVFEARLTRDREYSVMSASRGQDAYRAAVLKPFDLLLWDMRLHETAEMLPVAQALCPVAALILTTTDDRPVLSPELTCLNISAILVKPLGLETVMERVRHALTQPPAEASPAPIDLTRVGQQITIQSSEGLCRTRILEARQDTFAIVGAPRVATPDDFAPGRRVQAEVVGPDALYRFHTRLVRARTEPVPGWELRMPLSIARRQRRKHPRAYRPYRVLLTDASAPSELCRDGEKAVLGITENVSLGGCALISETPLGLGTTIHFSLDLPDRVLEGSGEVVQVHPITACDAFSPAFFSRYRIGVAFRSLEREDRRALRSLLASET